MMLELKGLINNCKKPNHHTRICIPCSFQTVMWVICCPLLMWYKKMAKTGPVAYNCDKVLSTASMVLLVINTQVGELM